MRERSFFAVHIFFCLRGMFDAHKYFGHIWENLAKIASNPKTLLAPFPCTYEQKAAQNAQHKAYEYSLNSR